MTTSKLKAIKIALLLIALSTTIFTYKKPNSHSLEERQNNIDNSNNINFVHLGNFSKDNSKISASFCTTDKKCHVGIIDTKNNELIEIIPTDNNEQWHSPRFSDSSKAIVFITDEYKNHDEFTQIGIVNLNTNLYEKITNSKSHKNSPGFSHNEKKIIFSKSGRRRESGITRYSRWDYFEVDLDSKEEQKLTNYCFFIAKEASYLPGDSEYIFSAESPACNVADDFNKSYKNNFKDNTIFTFNKNNELHPTLTRGSYSNDPKISTNGNVILFESISNDIDKISGPYKYDLFISNNKTISRLTDTGGIDHAILSGDATSIAYTLNGNMKIFLLNTSSKKTFEIDITALKRSNITVKTKEK